MALSNPTTYPMYTSYPCILSILLSSVTTYPISLSPILPGLVLPTYPYFSRIYYGTTLPTYLPYSYISIIYLVEYVVLGYGASPIAANRWLAIDYLGMLDAAGPWFYCMDYLPLYITIILCNICSRILPYITI